MFLRLTCGSVLMMSFSSGTFLHVFCLLVLIILTSIFKSIRLLSIEAPAVVLVVITTGLKGWWEAESKSPFLSHIRMYDAMMRNISINPTTKLTTLTFGTHVRLIKHSSGKLLMPRLSGVFVCLKSRNVLTDLFPKLSVNGKLWGL